MPVYKDKFKKACFDFTLCVRVQRPPLLPSPKLASKVHCLSFCGVSLVVLFHRLPGKCIEFTLPPSPPNDNAPQDVFELPKKTFFIDALFQVWLTLPVAAKMRGATQFWKSGKP